jgi:hypothetical protein
MVDMNRRNLAAMGVQPGGNMKKQNGVHATAEGNAKV